MPIQPRKMAREGEIVGRDNSPIRRPSTRTAQLGCGSHRVQTAAICVRIGSNTVGTVIASQVTCQKPASPSSGRSVARSVWQPSKNQCQGRRSSRFQQGTTRSPDGLLLRYAVAESGQPVVLLHPFSDGLESWWDIGLAGRLARRCRVIAIDARGHGGSDKPRESARYRIEHRVADVLAVLNAAQVDRAHVVGYSMGGWTALGLASLAPTRLRSLVIGGAHPYAQDLTQLRRLLDGGIERFCLVLERSLGALPRGVSGASGAQQSRRAVRGRRRRPDRPIESACGSACESACESAGRGDGANPVDRRRAGPGARGGLARRRRDPAEGIWWWCPPTTTSRRLPARRSPTRSRSPSRPSRSRSRPRRPRRRPHPSCPPRQSHQPRRSRRSRRPRRSSRSP